MRYGFINNFSQALAADLAAGATSMTLDSGGADLSNASADLVYALTLFDVINDVNEIVYVTGATGDTLTIERGKEGTVDLSWSSNSQVEARVTAGILTAGFIPMTGLVPTGYDSLAWGTGAQAVHEDGAVAIGQADDLAVLAGALATAARSIALGTGSEANALRSMALARGVAQGVDSVAIGQGAQATAVRSMALLGGATNAEDAFATGAGSVANGARAVALTGGSANGNDSLAFGDGATSGGADAVAVGATADAYGDNSLAVGRSSSAGEDGVAIGRGATSFYSAGLGPGMALGKNANAAPGTCALGEDAQAQAPAGMAAGKGASSMAPENVALGVGAAAMTPYSVALGPYASNASVPGGFQLNALSYLPATAIDTGTYAAPPATATRRASQQVVIATDPLDLTVGADVVTLDLPANTMLFIDDIDVVITGSTTPGGAPEIQVGTDAVTPADLLAATPVTATVVGERETYSPLIANGVTTLRVATSTAGSGTTYMARVIFRGYVMEL